MKVLVTVPNEGWIHKGVVGVLQKLWLDGRYQLHTMLPTHRPYENNLHHIVQDLLNGNADYWLNIDADNPPMQNPLDLIELDKDFIGFPTPVFHWTGKEGERPVYWNAYKRQKDGWTEWGTKEGLQEVDAVGTGCFLAPRRVFDALAYAPFQRTYYPDGRVEKGNDLAFCERAKAAGFRIWTHFDYPCRHFKEVDLAEVVQAFRALYEHG